MKGVLSILFFSILFLTNAQEEAYWSELFLNEINALRQANGFLELQADEVLSAAAFDQLEYCNELGRLVHIQENSKKETVAKRVYFYEGMHAQVEENLAEITKGSKEAISPNGERVLIDSDEKLAKAVVAGWLEEEKTSKLNLLDANFYRIGLSVFMNDDSKLLICAVFGTNPYQSLGAEKLNLKNYGIAPFDKNKCASFTDNFPSIAQLLSDVVKIENNRVVLKYHSSNFVKHLLSESSDAIALDWVDQSQFKCDQGTALFPGNIASGYLQKPVKRAFILNQNRADSIGAVDVDLGKIPTFYNAATTEHNLLLIKDGVHCATVPFNKLESFSIKKLPLELAVTGEQASNVFTWQDSISLQIPLLNGGLDSLESAKETMKGLNFLTESEITTIQLSPLLSSKKQEYENKGFDNIYIAWDSLDQFVRNTFYQLDLDSLNEEAKIQFLEKAQEEDEKLKKFLFELNEIQYAVKGKATIELSEKVEQQLKLYKFFLENGQIEPALFVQSKLINKVIEGNLTANLLPQADPNQKAATLSVLNNQIVLEKLMGKTEYGGNPIYLALYELYLINPSQPQVAFNYHVQQLEYWVNNYSQINELATWLEGFKKINTTLINPEKYARAQLNFQLLAMNYYYDKQDFMKRKKAFTEIMKWESKANLSLNERLDLAKTLCFQDQFNLAVELLLPEIKKEEPTEELLFYFLQIAIYDKSQVNPQFYISCLKKAQNLYKPVFCNLFSTDKMGKQSFKSADIKNLFCESCD